MKFTKVDHGPRHRQIKPTDIPGMALHLPKADPGPARRARAPPPPPFEKKGTFLGKFSLYIRKYFDFSQHAVFTICILFTPLLIKT